MTTGQFDNFARKAESSEKQASFLSLNDNFNVSES